MKKTAIAILAASVFVGACTTDPYTGETVRSNTRTGAPIVGWVGAWA